MKVLCCGDRDWTSWRVIEETLQGLGPNTIIVHGDARGADKMSGYVAKRLGFQVKAYPADWDKHGKAAGPIRNRLMFDSEQPELVIAFHNDLNSSKGTKDMVKYARSMGCPVNVVTEEG
jgi:hypothetical protein